MKFEKLSENKIKITLSMRDLEEKEIDFHEFMSNSLETQDLFLDMLEEAEEKIGFKTRNCKVKIEALAMTEDDFVLTITKFPSDAVKTKLYVTPKRKIKSKRKTPNMTLSYLIYQFNSFDDYCNFIEFLLNHSLSDANKIAKEAYVYLYNNSYYLILHNLDSEYHKINTIISAISEFSTYICNPDLYVHKLMECGTLVIKNNAFKKSFPHFQKNKTISHKK